MFSWKHDICRHFFPHLHYDECEHFLTSKICHGTHFLHNKKNIVVMNRNVFAASFYHNRNDNGTLKELPYKNNREYGGGNWRFACVWSNSLWIGAVVTEYLMNYMLGMEKCANTESTYSGVWILLRHNNGQAENNAIDIRSLRFDDEHLYYIRIQYARKWFSLNSNKTTICSRSFIQFTQNRIAVAVVTNFA